MAKNKKWDLIISSKRDWFNLDLRNIWKYRDLILFFIRRDITTEYKQTILGVLYHVINPIISTFIKVIIFGKIANLSTDGIPQFLFYLSGGIFWSYFARCLAIGKSVFLSNRDLYSQVYIPKLAVPIASNISEFIKLFMQILLFIFFFLYYQINGIDLIILNQIISVNILYFFFIVLCFLFIINGSNLIDGFNGLLALQLIIINSVLLFINIENENLSFSVFITSQIIILMVFL